MRFKPSIVADGRPWRATGAVVAALLMSACTSATLETVATGLEPAPMLGSDAVMSLGDAETLPAPAIRPGASVGLAEAGTGAQAAADPAAAAFAGSTPAMPAPVLDGPVMAAPPAEPAPPTGTAVLVADAAPSTAATAAADDPATQRIRAAANAPTAAGPAQTADPGAIAAIAGTDARTGSRPRFLTALFGSRRDGAGRPRPLVATASAATPRPVVAGPAERPRPVIATASARGNAAGLPGFDRARAFGIDANGDGDGEIEAPVQLASAAGLARLAPNGLRTQHAGVDVACLKPALVRLLKRVEQHYAKPVIVTSGYRSPTRNRAARGAKNSLHIYCAAADIQVPGVSKWDLAAYLRSMPGRGGVGTYCHTKSVHLDIGPRRDWNWRCRRRG